MAEVLPALRTSLSAPLTSAASRGGLPWDQQATGGALSGPPPAQPSIAGAVSVGSVLTITPGAGGGPRTRYRLLRYGVDAITVVSGYALVAADIGSIQVVADGPGGRSRASNALAYAGVASLTPSLLVDERGQVGNPIGTWSDQSGNARDFLQATVVNKPTAGTLNALAAPVFNGGAGGDWMAIAAGGWVGATSAAAFSIVVVIDNTGATPMADSGVGVYDEPCLIGCDDGSGIGLSWSSGGPRAFAYDGAYKNTPRITASVGRHVLHMKLSAGTLSLALDGAVPVTVASGNVVGGAGGTLARIGANWNAAKGFAGTLAEVFARGTALSAGDEADLLAFLVNKYQVMVGA